jgi:nucleoside-diphosphate-sugar epimerase
VKSLVLGRNGFIECMAAVVGERPAVEYQPACPLDVPVSVLGVGRAREDLGWESRTELGEGIDQAWAWIQSVSESKVEY